MADFTVTTTAQSGSGSITEAISQIRDGETITFDDSLIDEQTGVILIELSSQLILTAYNFTIEGGAYSGSGATLKTRVVFDAQLAARCLINQTNGTKTINGVTFKNGKAPSGSTGGGVQNQQTLVLNNCVFDACTTTDNSGAGLSSVVAATSTLNNCLIKSCQTTQDVNVYGGGVYTAGTSTTVFNGCAFVDNTASYQANDIFMNASANVTINGCTFSNQTENGLFDIYCLTSTVFNSTGNNAIRKLYTIAEITINGNLTAEVLTINNGATVTFADSAVLDVTDSVTLGTGLAFSAASGETGSFHTTYRVNTTNITFTNVTYSYDYVLVTSTADSGAGTLREALSVAANGDTIRFADSLEVDGVITITVNSVLDAPAVNVTIDGGGHWTESGELKTRVVLNATAGVGDEFKVIRGNVSNVCTLNNLTLQNGYISSSTNFGAGLQLRTGGYSITNYINYCVFKNNEGGNYGGGVSLYAGVAEFNNCVFDGNKAINGAAVLTYQSARATLNNCRVVNNNNTNNASGCVYLMSTSCVNLSNCVFSGNTGRDISNNSTRSTESLIVTGTNTLTGTVYISSSSIASFSGSFTCGSLSGTIGSTITFNGVDSILAVTTTFSASNTTFQVTTDSTGYLALPYGTTPPTVGTGVKVASYSNGVSAISASINERTATLVVTNSTAISPLIEYRSSGDTGAWTTLNVVDGQATIGDDRAFKVRAFDGAKFTEGTTVPRTYYYQGSASSGSFGTASDWAMDSAKTMTCNATPTIAGGTFRL